ncbi:MAG: peptide deformylase [Pyrinomonadaceae bacterium]|nr:peptide deformylase [Pyrinomonadaceae bacterium]
MDAPVISRPLKARLRAQSEKAESYGQDAERYAARASMHETDHFDGKLFMGHLPKLRRDMLVNSFKKEKTWTQAICQRTYSFIPM